MRKSLIWKPYSKSSIQSSVEVAQIVQQVLNNDLRSQVAAWSRDGTAVTAVKECKMLVLKFTSYLVFGEEKAKAITKDYATHEMYADAISHAVALDTPGFIKAQASEVWNRLCEMTSLKLHAGTNEARHLSERMCSELCRACVNDARAQMEPPSLKVHLTSVCAHMHRKLQGTHRPGELQQKVLASEMFDHLLAATEALGLAFTYVLYELSRHMTIQQDLRKEMRDLRLCNQPTFQESRLDLLDELPLLDAVVLETLRLHAPAKGPFPRIVPGGGSQIGPYQGIPAGTVVSTSADYLHLSSSTYEEPNQWRPHRWLTQDAAVLANMHKSFWAFSSGPRMCIAKHFSMRSESN